jgi:hypothetical protein
MESHDSLLQQFERYYEKLDHLHSHSNSSSGDGTVTIKKSLQQFFKQLTALDEQIHEMEDSVTQFYQQFQSIGTKYSSDLSPSTSGATENSGSSKVRWQDRDSRDRAVRSGGGRGDEENLHPHFHNLLYSSNTAPTVAAAGNNLGQSLNHYQTLLANLQQQQQFSGQTQQFGQQGQMMTSQPDRLLSDSETAVSHRKGLSNMPIMKKEVNYKEKLQSIQSELAAAQHKQVHSLQEYDRHYK